MYKIEIDISPWGGNNEKVVIETCDFDKVQIIQEFIDLQMDNGWAVDYAVIEEEDEEDEEDEPTTVSTYVITKIEE